MPYRTAPEKKPVKVKKILTRGEVAKIVQTHLQDNDSMPAQRVNPKTVMASLSAQHTGQPDPTPPPGKESAPWEAWPALVFEWDEEVP